MPLPALAERQARLRHLLFLRDPRFWPLWPVLPVRRDTPGGDDHGAALAAKYIAGRRT